MAFGYLKNLVFAGTVVAVAAAPCLAIDPRFELDTRRLNGKVAEPAKEKAPREPEKPVAPPPAREGKLVSHVVKPGDHVFRILMRDYGLSNSEAERLVPEIKRLNKIDDIRVLRVGSSILLPLGGKGGKGSVATASPKKKVRKTVAVQREEPARTQVEPEEPVVHQMTMVRLASPPPVDEGVEVLRQVWEKLMPAAPADHRPLEVKESNFGVSLDPDRFPVIPSATGGKIVVDPKGAIPPLVRSLLADRDPNLRVVTESPTNRKRFFSAVLSAADFYSVEEDFVLDFGSDPRLKVRADFKVEKSPDSLLKHDVVLMNVGQATRAMPDRLVDFLGSEGFKVVEATAGKGIPAGGTSRFYSVRGTNSRQVADSFLKALSLRYEPDRDLELNSWENRGIRMYVKVDRYLENNGERYAITWFDGNPVNYTLARLLETVGFRVVVLDEKDDFHRIADKLITRLRLPGRYGVHSLWPAADTPYSVEMSGVMVKGTGSGGSTFITNVPTTPLIDDLLTYNGYTVHGD